MQINFTQLPDSTNTPIPQIIKDTSSLINNTDTTKIIKPKKDSTIVIKKADSLKSTNKDTTDLSKKTDSVKAEIKESSSKNDNTSEVIEISNDISETQEPIIYQGVSYKPEIVVQSFNYETNKGFTNNVFQKTFLLYGNENITIKKDIVESIDTSKVDTTKTYLSNIKPIQSIDTSNNIKIKNADWFLAILIIVLSIATVLKLLYSRYFSDSIKSLWSYQHASKLFKENNVVNQRLSFFSNILFVFSFSMFAILCADFYSISDFSKNNFFSFLIISGIITMIYLIKYAVYKILGHIFTDSGTYAEYLYNVFQFNRIAGIFLIPIIIALAYSTIYYTDSIVYLGFMVLIIVFIMRIIRGIQICAKVNFSIFYSFLYLCTLEILPLLVIFKLIKINI